MGNEMSTAAATAAEEFLKNEYPHAAKKNNEPVSKATPVAPRQSVAPVETGNKAAPPVKPVEPKKVVAPAPPPEPVMLSYPPDTPVICYMTTQEKTDVKKITWQSVFSESGKFTQEDLLRCRHPGCLTKVSSRDGRHPKIYGRVKGGNPSRPREVVLYFCPFHIGNLPYYWMPPAAEAAAAYEMIMDIKREAARLEGREPKSPTTECLETYAAQPLPLNWSDASSRNKNVYSSHDLELGIADGRYRRPTDEELLAHGGWQIWQVQSVEDRLGEDWLAIDVKELLKLVSNVAMLAEDSKDSQAYADMAEILEKVAKCGTAATALARREEQRWRKKQDSFRQGRVRKGLGPFAGSAVGVVPRIVRTLREFANKGGRRRR